MIPRAAPTHSEATPAHPRSCILHMDDPARYASEKPVDMPEAKTDRYRQRLHQLGIDLDADPIDTLIQLTDYCQKLGPKT